MKTKMFFLGLFILTAGSVLAEKNHAVEPAAKPIANNTLAGVVIDKSTGESLTGVEIRIDGTELKTYTDFDGKFVFEGLTPGEYKVSTNMISYKENETSPVKIKNNNELHALNLHLETVEK